MLTRRAFRAAVLAICFAPALLHAQSRPPAVDDLLRRALDALNNLTYERADSLARQVFAQGRRATEDQRAIAYLLIAAAAYPEERSRQRRSAALGTLRDVVRTNPDLTVPSELTWPGLDSLVLEAKRTTYGASVAVDTVQEVTGPSSALIFRVAVSRATTVELVITAEAGDAPVLRDSTIIAQTGELAVFGLHGTQPRFKSGTYRIAITARDMSSPDSVRYSYLVDVASAPLTLLPQPDIPDSSKLLPERGKRPRALLSAITVGASALALSVVRGGGNIPSEVSVDAKGVGVTALLAAAAFTIARRDAGRALPENVAANQAYVRAYSRYSSGVRGENRRRLDSHTTTFRLVLEGAQ